MDEVHMKAQKLWMGMEVGVELQWVMSTIYIYSFINYYNTFKFYHHNIFKFLK